MFFRFFITISFFILQLSALSISSNDEYKVIEKKNYSIIYTPANEKEALYIKSNIDSYLKAQDKSYGYSFDEPILISLISPDIQIANAYSMQTPFNQNLFYGGGVQYIDYFSSSSWLDTLLYHEISHNYQLNSKNNSVSKSLHTYLGNNYIPLFVPIPIFTQPNLLLPTALLEGNAVLNETIFSNGGRLYNGRFNALTNILIKHDRVDKTIFINDHLDFPYGEEKYIVGGYYMLYLAQKYGVDKVNLFYQEHSKHFINPLLLNDTFKRHFQISFDQSFKEFVESKKLGLKEFDPIESQNYLATSKQEIYLNKQDDTIFFLSNDKITQPRLNIYDIKKDKLKTKRGNWLNGKVFKIDKSYYTSSQNYIKPTLYKNGLFDKDRFIKDNTQAKAVQDIYKDKTLYFDVNSSFDTPSLFLNGSFYDKANSSAIFDKEGNIYYFKQEKGERTLYKNKKALFSIEVYFSKIVDIDGDTIYFIANTKNGSTLYRYRNEKISKALIYDNIIDAKLINKKNILAVSINHDGYRVYKLGLENIYENISYTYLDIEQKKPFGDKTQNQTQNIQNAQNYNELKELRFSLLYPSLSYSSDDGVMYSFDGYFFDPLMFNMLSLYAYKYEDERYAGFDYINERYIPFELNIYDSKKDIETPIDRGYGGYLSIYGPIYKAGSHEIQIELKKYFDDENRFKAPVISTLSHDYTLDFGASFSPYFSSELELYLKNDRDDLTYGAGLKLSRHIYKESYINASIKSVKSNTNTLNTQRGIKIYEDEVDDMDSSDIYSAGIDNDLFVKDITKTSLGFSKTINLSKYFFTFPLSLRRESIYLNYRDYSYTQNIKGSFYEKEIGISFDTLLVHTIAMPIDIKYIENSLSKDDYTVLFSISFEL